jgi:hypothetical protein
MPTTSRGGVMIEIAHAAESIESNDPTVGIRRLRCTLNQPALEPLLVSLVVVAGDELGDRSPKMPLTQRYDPIETF